MILLLGISSQHNWRKSSNWFEGLPGLKQSASDGVLILFTFTYTALQLSELPALKTYAGTRDVPSWFTGMATN
jgi:hypothetical protein